MSVEFYRKSPGKFDSRTLDITTLNRWTGRILMFAAGRHSRRPTSPVASKRELGVVFLARARINKRTIIMNKEQYMKLT